MSAFHWAGFDLHVRYTYTIPDVSDRERVWAGFLTNVRGHIRSAEKTLAVREDLGLEDFLHTYEQVFRGKNHKMPFSRSFLERVDQALASRQQRRMFFAVDARERVHAAVYLVWDHNKAYYLMGGRDPGFSSSSAVSLLIWHAIQHAASVATLFDFEGSLNPSTVFRDFGAVQTLYYRLTGQQPAGRAARHCGDRVVTVLTTDGRRQSAATARWTVSPGVLLATLATFRVADHDHPLYQPWRDEQRLAAGCGKPSWPGGAPLAVCLTHDVDSVVPSAPPMYWRRVVNQCRCLCGHTDSRMLRSLQSSLRGLIWSLNPLRRKGPLDDYQRWLMEAAVGARSTFFLPHRHNWPHHTDGGYHTGRCV
jgi:hypothetical protein